MKRTNLLAYVLGAMALAGVTVAVTGCGVSTPSSGQTPPAFGAAVVVANVGGSGQVLTYNESLDVVCLENGISGAPARFQMAAFSCWETRSAPQTMQELVTRYLSGKK